MSFELGKAITLKGDERKRYFRRIGIWLESNPYMGMEELKEITKKNDIEILEQCKSFVKLKQDKFTYIIFTSGNKTNYCWLNLFPIMDLELLYSLSGDEREKYTKETMWYWVSSATFSPSTSEYILKYFSIEIEKVSDEKYVLKQGNNQYIVPVKETFYPFEIIESFDVAQLKKFSEKS